MRNTQKSGQILRSKNAPARLEGVGGQGGQTPIFFAKSWFGNPAGRLRGSRNRLSEAVICALLRDFEEHGEKAIAKVRRTQPAAYLKVLALLVPREHKVEHRNPLKE